MRMLVAALLGPGVVAGIAVSAAAHGPPVGGPSGRGHPVPARGVVKCRPRGGGRWSGGGANVGGSGARGMEARAT
jgi:hypothetical protein